MNAAERGKPDRRAKPRSPALSWGIQAGGGEVGEASERAKARNFSLCEAHCRLALR